MEAEACSFSLQSTTGSTASRALRPVCYIPGTFVPGVPALPAQPDGSYYRLCNLSICVVIAFPNPVSGFLSFVRTLGWLQVTEIQVKLT